MGGGGGGVVVPMKNVGDFGAICARRAMNRSGSCARSSWRYDSVKPLLREGYQSQNRLKWKIRRMKPMLQRDAYAGGHVVVEEMDNVIVHKNLLFSAKTAVLGNLHCKNIEHVG